jgi:hypothetical protein
VINRKFVCKSDEEWFFSLTKRTEKIRVWLNDTKKWDKYSFGSKSSHFINFYFIHQISHNAEPEPELHYGILVCRHLLLFFNIFKQFHLSSLYKKRTKCRSKGFLRFFVIINSNKGTSIRFLQSIIWPPPPKKNVCTIHFQRLVYAFAVQHVTGWFGLAIKF